MGFGSPGPYFRLIEAGLKLLKDPSVICVEEVYLILQQLVGTVLSSKDFIETRVSLEPWNAMTTCDEAHA